MPETDRMGGNGYGGSRIREWSEQRERNDRGSTPCFVTARFRSQMTGMVGLPRANSVSEWE